MQLKDFTEQDLKNFVKEYVKNCLIELYDKVRLDKEHTDWEFVSRMFTIEDIDYIREFINYIDWKFIKKEIIENKRISNEFKDVIEWKSI